MIVGVLLAAGASSRMGTPKALVRKGGQSFLVHGVRALWGACDTVVAVVGAEGERICDEVGDEFDTLVANGLLAPESATGRGRTGDLEVRFEIHRKWAEGMLSSARVGLAAALKHKPKGVLLMPVDQPDVRPGTAKLLGDVLEDALGAFGGARAGGFAYALVPRHRGRRGHPLALSAGLAAAIVADRAARDLSDAVRRNARLVGYLDVADPAVVSNLNTPAAVRASARPAAPNAAARPARKNGGKAPGKSAAKPARKQARKGSAKSAARPAKSGSKRRTR
ncbi:MAG: NTP transferase domain-containing protein [bacterium]